MPTKIFTASPHYPVQCLDVTTKDGRCLALWSKPLAKQAGLPEPTELQEFLAGRDHADDWLDIIINAPELNEQNVKAALTWIFGPVQLV